MEELESITVADLSAFAELVEEDRVGVSWSVLSDIGPEWIGSRRKLNFFVDGILMAENEFTNRLASALIEGLAIPATTKDLVITGEGDLRRNGSSIEVVYDWAKAMPYDNPVETGSGVFTLVKVMDT